QLNFWTPEGADLVTSHLNVDIQVNDEDVLLVKDLLQRSGMEYEVLIEDLQKAIERQFDNKHRSTVGYSYEKYNSWEKIAEWAESMATENPTLVTKTQIGQTFEGRPMVLLKAVTSYGSDPEMTSLLNNMDVLVLPVFNIDGYVYTWTRDRMWRKTRSKNSGTTCVGTDPNRNFNAGWCTVGASKQPCSETYCGSRVESEIEVKAVADFIRKNRSIIKAYLTIHSYSQLLLFPYSYTTDLAAHHSELLDIARTASNALYSLYGTRYTSGPGAVTIYPAAGGSDDWAYDLGIKYSFTFELRDEGRFGFLLPESQIKPTCEETMLAVKYIATYVQEHNY
ncbi:CBPB1 Carboxypeptidase, partial [Polypterus senegalus]